MDEERSLTSSRTSSKSRTRERRRSYGGHSRGVREDVFVFLRHRQRRRICICKMLSGKTYFYL